MIYMRSKNDSLTLCVNPTHGLDHKGWSFLALKLNNFRELKEEGLFGKANLLALEYLQAYSSWRLEKYQGYRGYHEASSLFIFEEEALLGTIHERIGKTITQMKSKNRMKKKASGGNPKTSDKLKTSVLNEL